MYSVKRDRNFKKNLKTSVCYTKYAYMSLWPGQLTNREKNNSINAHK